MRKKISLGTILEIVTPLAIVASWFALSARSTDFYFPPLSKILGTFQKTWLFQHAWSDAAPSLYRVVVGFGIAVLLAIPLGIWLGVSQRAYNATSLLLEFARSIPPPALIPFAIVVFGIGDSMKLFIIALVCLFPVLLNTIDGVRSTESTYLETARVYSIPRRTVIRHVVVPAALPRVYAGLRTGTALALLMMVVSEMEGSVNGIGYFILKAARNFAIPEMWAGMLLLGILGYAINLVLVLIERRALRWYYASRAQSGK